MVKKFSLRSPNEDGSIEAYLQEAPPKSHFIHKIMGPPRNYPQKDHARENLKLLRRIQKNPNVYFNFGFTPKEFALFLNKHLVMRLEKQIIRMKLKKLQNGRGK